MTVSSAEPPACIQNRRRLRFRRAFAAPAAESLSHESDLIGFDCDGRAGAGASANSSDFGGAAGLDFGGAGFVLMSSSSVEARPIVFGFDNWNESTAAAFVRDVGFTSFRAAGGGSNTIDGLESVSRMMSPGFSQFIRAGSPSPTRIESPARTSIIHRPAIFRITACLSATPSQSGI